MGALLTEMLRALVLKQMLHIKHLQKFQNIHTGRKNMRGGETNIPHLFLFEFYRLKDSRLHTKQIDFHKDSINYRWLYPRKNDCQIIIINTTDEGDYQQQI